MTQFHEGQDVEVLKEPNEFVLATEWRKAKIVGPATTGMEGMAPATPGYIIQFADGACVVFDAAHIRRRYDLTAEDIGLLHDDIAPEG